MTRFIFICQKCEAEIPFRHPAVATLEQAKNIGITCPNCGARLRVDRDAAIKLLTVANQSAEVIHLESYKRGRNDHRHD